MEHVAEKNFFLCDMSRDKSPSLNLYELSPSRFVCFLGNIIFIDNDYDGKYFSLSVCFRTIPDWLSWLQYISWFNYGFEAMNINQWKGYGNIRKKSYKYFESCVDANIANQ